MLFFFSRTYISATRRYRVRQQNASAGESSCTDLYDRSVLDSNTYIVYMQMTLGDASFGVKYAAVTQRMSRHKLA